MAGLAALSISKRKRRGNPEINREFASSAPVSPFGDFARQPRRPLGLPDHQPCSQ